MRRLTRKQGDNYHIYRYDELGKVETRMIILDENNCIPLDIKECIKKLSEYENTELTPEEVSRLYTLIEQQGKELNRRDELIRKIDEDRVYWELEAKKWADKLANLRYQIQLGKCENCKFEDTSQCKEC